MRVTVRYKNYPYSEEATSWSRARGYLSSYAFLVILMLFYLFYKILGDSYILAAVVLAIAGTVGLNLLCSKMEAKCASRDALATAKTMAEQEKN